MPGAVEFGILCVFGHGQDAAWRALKATAWASTVLVGTRTPILSDSSITLSQLESHLWESANILRGPVDAADFKTYIFPLLFFKRICDVCAPDDTVPAGRSAHRTTSGAPTESETAQLARDLRPQGEGLAPNTAQHPLPGQVLGQRDQS